MLLALDLGSTSLAGQLFDASGRVAAEAQSPNPQTIFGADIIRRLEVARDGEGKALQAALVAGVNDLVATLLDRSGADPGSIMAAAAAANPGVTLLLQNLPPDPILVPPYRPKNGHAVILPPGFAGLNLPAPLYLFPLVNGFVGGDLVAFLFGQEAPRVPTLYIDIGTNGEIALCAEGRWWVTSVAAGPAFEGGDIGSGMLYGPGAIRGCRVAGDRLDLDTVGDVPPRGLCGTGVVEVVGAALDAGLIDRHGTVTTPDAMATNLARYLHPTDEGMMLQLYRDAGGAVVLTQGDIRNFQLAKAAIRAGVECLIAKAGLESGAIESVVMTGAFGFSLAPKALKRVALLPANMVDKVRFEASGALTGVSRMLMLEDGPMQVEEFAGTLQPYPLSGTPTFEQAFIKSIDF